jgi:hypothetical protein
LRPARAPYQAEHRAAYATGEAEKERPSEFAPGTLRKFSLDFISAKVQPEVGRNANAKSVRASKTQLMGSLLASHAVRFGAGRAWNSRGRTSLALPVCAGYPNPANSDQNRRTEYLKGWSVVNWDNALAKFKKAIARDACGYSRISAPPKRSLRERSPDHRRKIELNIAIRTKHRERLHFRLGLRSAR